MAETMPIAQPLLKHGQLKSSNMIQTLDKKHTNATNRLRTFSGYERTLFLHW